MIDFNKISAGRIEVITADEDTSNIPEAFIL